MNASQSLQVVIGLAIITLVGTIIIGVLLAKMSRKTSQDNKKMFENIAADIMLGCRTPHRWRYIGDDRYQFVQLILGRVAGEHVAWARVTVGRNQVIVSLECDYRIKYDELLYIHALADVLKEKGAKVDVDGGVCQPDPGEMFAPAEEQIV